MSRSIGSGRQREASKRTFARVGALASLLLAVVLIAPLVLAARADAYVYFVDSRHEIGRANLDGSGVDRGFITPPGDVIDIAIDADHVYWTTYFENTIGRANLDGSGVEESFITLPVGEPGAVAVDAGHVYWTNSLPTGYAIGRANVDGSGVDQSFITPLFHGVRDVAIDAGHVYWTAGFVYIGRANLDGSGLDEDFAIGGLSPATITVDAGHIYWTNLTSITGALETTIGRANLDGSGVDGNFITGVSTRPGLPGGVAVDAGHVYWAHLGAPGSGGAAIGRANLDGSGVDEGFSTVGGDYVYNIAVDALVDTKPPKTKLINGAPKTTEKTTVKFKFESSEPDSSFECKLDKGKWKACSSPKKYKDLKRGRHKFEVRATDAAGNTGEPVKDKFKVVD